MSGAFKSTVDVLDAALPEITDLPADFIAAIDQLGDALATLIMREPATWTELCEREAQAESARFQCWKRAGTPPEGWPPERTLGRIVLEAFAIRYPHFLSNRRPPKAAAADAAD